jgi:hypothetical protein
VITPGRTHEQELIVTQEVFGTKVLIAHLGRLADREQHAGHRDRYLTIESATNRFMYYCGTCRTTIAYITVTLEAQ